MNKNESAKKCHQTSPPTPVLFSLAFFFGLLGFHNFATRQVARGLLHMAISIAAYLATVLSGNLLPVLVILPMNWTWSLYEAATYSQNREMKAITKDLAKTKHISKNRKKEIDKTKNWSTISLVVLWTITLFFMVRISYLFILDSQSPSDAGLPGAIALFVYAPIGIPLLICAIVSTRKTVNLNKIDESVANQGKNNRKSDTETTKSKEYKDDSF